MEKILEAIRKAAKIKNCREWKRLKNKWDRNIPSKNSSLFQEYQQDCKAAQGAIDTL